MLDLLSRLLCGKTNSAGRSTGAEVRRVACSWTSPQLQGALHKVNHASQPTIGPSANWVSAPAEQCLGSVGVTEPPSAFAARGGRRATQPRPLQPGRCCAAAVPRYCAARPSSRSCWSAGHFLTWHVPALYACGQITAPVSRRLAAHYIAHRGRKCPGCSALQEPRRPPKAPLASLHEHKRKTRAQTKPPVSTESRGRVTTRDVVADLRTCYPHARRRQALEAAV